MVKTLEVSVRDILQRESFKKATVFAGEKGLDNPVRWTHILETDQLESLINGNEFILTTGYGLQLDSPKGITYIQKLIEKKAAGLCIELGTHMKTIDPQIIELANQHHFPIVVFSHFVKFVNITQDIHSFIIGTHHEILKSVNRLSTTFNELSLLPNGIKKILEALYTHLGGKTLFLTKEGDSFYYPPETKKLERAILEMDKHPKIDSRSFLTLENENFIAIPVKSSGVTWGNLYVKVQADTLESSLYSVMDQATLAIAQIMLRNRTMEEREQNQEDKMVRDILYGKLTNADELKEVIPQSEKYDTYRLLLLQKKDVFEAEDAAWNEIQLQQAMLLKTTLKQQQFPSVISVGKNEIAILAFFNQQTAEQDKVNFHQTLQMIQQFHEEAIFIGEEYFFGVSQPSRDITKAHEGYREAKQVLFLQQAGIDASYLFEDIGLYQFLLNQSRHHLESYVANYLHPISSHDERTNSELLKTLEIYLSCNLSKKETAERLFIVRQSLYHRLNKIEELLGDRYLETDYRLALETAFKAKQLLSSYS